jgi:hypothetical protein
MTNRKAVSSTKVLGEDGEWVALANS